MNTLYVSGVTKLITYLLLLAVMSCTAPGKKEQINPDTQFRGNVKMNGKDFITISTADCETLGGYQVKSSNGIIIRATDLKSINTLTIYVYYKNASELAPGKRLSLANDSYLYPSFSVGAYEYDTGQTWDTGLDGEVSGSLVIKSFDNATGLASFDVAFDAMLNQGGQLVPNRKASFKGSFENVPIFPDEDAWSSCDKAQQGFGNNSGNGNGNPGNGNGNGNPGNGNGNGNPGNGNGNTGGSTITFNNKTFVPIDITFNGEAKTIPFNSSVTFTGNAGSRASGQATCSGKTATGTQVGAKMSWNLDYNFPAMGGQSINLNVGTSYFFLQMQNKSGSQITKLLVNYGLQSQTQDNISIPADGRLYNIGYYKAFSNSNVRAENTTNNTYWSWPSLSLPFTENQSKLLTANP